MINNYKIQIILSILTLQTLIAVNVPRLPSPISINGFNIIGLVKKYLIIKKFLI